jgi:mRNA-degrading endonuclease YafQ of YafQ-DinJ toxin-antitoxin module
MLIRYSGQFNKVYQKRIKDNRELRELFWDAMEIFAVDPDNSALNTHPLKDRLEGKWAFSVTYDCRVIFHFVSETEVVLLNIGSHQQVYK